MTTAQVFKRTERLKRARVVLQPRLAPPREYKPKRKGAFPRFLFRP